MRLVYGSLRLNMLIDSSVAYQVDMSKSMHQVGHDAVQQIVLTGIVVGG
jgi:hypothetical protein